MHSSSSAAKWLLALLILTPFACTSPTGEFICTSDSNCNAGDVAGRCEASGHCSFPSLNCAGHYEYGEYSGQESNQCVGDMGAKLDAGQPTGDAEVVPVDAASLCEWDVGFDILNIGPCGPMMAGEVGPGEKLILNDEGIYRLNTSTGRLQQPDLTQLQINRTVVIQSDGSELFVLTASSLNLGSLAILKVIGTRPLAIVTTGEILIHGIINASARSDTNGPGGNDFCDGGVGNLDSHGGGGGGFGSPGGNGGIPAGLGNPALGGPVLGDESLVPLRGGCRGGAVTAGGAVGGGAGGAIELVSRTQIEISGKIYASGGGGGGGGSSELSGGGGGGSGGAILLQSLKVNAPAFSLIVSGGGGGGGGSFSSGDNGNDGAKAGGGIGGEGGEPNRTTGIGGTGGHGASNTFPVENGANSTRPPPPAIPSGAGGGGGGLGHVRIVEN